MVEILSKRINGHDLSPKGTLKTYFTSYKYECVSTEKKERKKRKNLKKKGLPCSFPSPTETHYTNHHSLSPLLFPLVHSHPTIIHHREPPCTTSLPLKFPTTALTSIMDNHHFSVKPPLTSRPPLAR
jgi:hypothetical protein